MVSRGKASRSPVESEASRGVSTGTVTYAALHGYGRLENGQLSRAKPPAKHIRASQIQSHVARLAKH